MKNTKRSLALFLTLVMVLSMMTMIVCADENADGVEALSAAYSPEDAYVYNYGGGYPYRYFSPYCSYATYYGGSYPRACGGTPAIMNLYNTQNGQSVAVYCADTITDLQANSNFRRLNLEDSTYAASTAGKLRSILLQGFPNVGVETLGVAAGVEDLTIGEAIAAMQAAIWQVIHGNRIQYDSFFYDMYSEDIFHTGTVQFYSESHEEVGTGYASFDNEETVNAHIAQVYNYLINLAPTAAGGVAVSGTSFVSWSDAPILTKNEDGTFHVTVTATVHVAMSGSDRLTLSAVMGNNAYCASTALSGGNNTYTLTIPNVPAEVAKGDVKLAIDGYQTVCDVFLFDAEGDRSTSQSLIGIDNSQQPVHAEITVEPPLVINIHKTGGGQGLEGIQFDIFFIADREDYLTGKVTLNEVDAQQYINSTATYTMITDANGDASLNLTQKGLPDGIYLIIEKKHPAVLSPVDPFYVIMPATSADGARFEYTVNIYPKNEVRGAPGITKDVMELDCDYAEENACDPQTWIITADIPVDIGTGKKYVISDTLDYRLDYLGNVKVQVEKSDGSVVELPLREKTDYSLTVTNVETPMEDGATDAFTVELTASGMAAISSWLTPFGSNLPDVDDYKIRVYFDAQINSNAQMGVKIPNQATLDYTNPVGVTYDTARSDIPEVVTGGTKLKKVDAADETQTLAGAEFKLYRKATQEEVADPSVVTVMLNDMVEPMVEVAFFSNPDLAGEKVTTASSGQDGLIYIYGLAYGTYYAVETKAPDGYNLTYKPVEIIINEQSHTEGMEIVVLNKTGTVLPTTGGIGTGIFAVLGIAIMMIAGSALLVKRKEHV